MDNRVYVISDSRLQEDKKLEVTEEFTKKLFSTFERVYDELELRSNGKKVIFEPEVKYGNGGLIKTFNFNLRKNIISPDNIEYIFSHGNNEVKICSKFPLNGTIVYNKFTYFITELQNRDNIVEYLDLVKRYLDYYVLDRNKTEILKNGKLSWDLISEQDIKNREINGYSYLLN